jgi:hypothetical protein
MHLDALENLVMLRGGIDELEITNPRLAMIVNLSDILPRLMSILTNLECLERTIFPLRLL